MGRGVNLKFKQNVKSEIFLGGLEVVFRVHWQRPTIWRLVAIAQVRKGKVDVIIFVLIFIFFIIFKIFYIF